MHDADQLARRAGLAAGMTREEDQYVEGTFKVAVNAVVGNPHLSEQEVEEKGWQELILDPHRGRSVSLPLTRPEQ